MELKIDIKNFGVIQEAQINLNQINIIAGKNASGKSTLSKVLYSFLASLSPVKHKLTNMDKIKLINGIVREIEFNFNEDKKMFDENNHVLNNILNIFSNIEQDMYVDHSSKYDEVINQLKNILNNTEFDDKTKNLIQNRLEKLEKTLNHKRSILFLILNLEFGISELFQQESVIRFIATFGKNKFTSEITVESKGSMSLDENIKGTGNDVFYIDSQQNLNVVLRCNSYPIFYSINTPLHTAELFEIITSVNQSINHYKSVNSYEKEYYNEILDIGKKLEEIIHGKILFDSKTGEFKYKSNGKNYRMHNSASGIKQIGILQYLLNNLIIKENSFLIIDEPEVNLHPEWQVKLAEILVLLVKELNVSIYINSHSPQFIEAIEVYSTKYELSDKTMFYLTQYDENSDKFIFSNVSKEDLPILYNNLGDPYDIIDEIRVDNLYNHSY